MIAALKNLDYRKNEVYMLKNKLAKVNPLDRLYHAVYSDPELVEQQLHEKGIDPRPCIERVLRFISETQKQWQQERDNQESWIERVANSLLGKNTFLLGFQGPIYGAVAAASGTVERVVSLNNGGRIELSVNEDGIGTLTGDFREPDSVNIIVFLDVEKTDIPIGRDGNEVASTLELKTNQEIPIWLKIKEQNQLEDIVLRVYSANK
jgi:hypothetical protein